MTVSPRCHARSTLLFAAALAYAAITAPATAQTPVDRKADYSDGTLSYSYDDCQEDECAFAFIGCEDDPYIQFSMGQSEVAAWIGKSNGRVLLKVGQASIETIPDEIGYGAMDDNWWPNISLADEKTFWELLQPGQTLEITVGPDQLTLAIPKEIEDVRKSCKQDTE